MKGDNGNLDEQEGSNEYSNEQEERDNAKLGEQVE